MKNRRIPFLRRAAEIWLCLLISSLLQAQTPELLEKEIQSLDKQAAQLQNEYDRLRLANEERLRNVEKARQRQDSAAEHKELRAAYVAAEEMGKISTRLHAVRQEKIRLCRQWRQANVRRVDGLLISAEKERDLKKRAELGKRIQESLDQGRIRCPESEPEALSEHWRSVQIEKYDGPPELQHKILLLEDISRELRVRTAEMDSKYQSLLRELRTKERAKEFVQEGTLFHDGSTMLVASRSTAGAQGVVELGHQSSTMESGTSSILSHQDWHLAETPQDMEKEYRLAREEMLSLQQEVRSKIRELEERAKALKHP